MKATLISREEWGDQFCINGEIHVSHYNYVNRMADEHIVIGPCDGSCLHTLPKHVAKCVMKYCDEKTKGLRVGRRKGLRQWNVDKGAKRRTIIENTHHIQFSKEELSFRSRTSRAKK